MRRKKGERQASAVSADLAVARAAVKAADVRVERLERELAEASLCLLCRSRPGWRREGSSGLCWRCARGAERAGEEAFWRGFYGPRRPSGAHGSERRYVTGCRCEQCRRAQALRELDELWPVS